MGVNQGGNSSGLLFRKYMGDLSDYLKSEFGDTIGSKIVAHVLWAYDLVLLSDELHGIWKQLGGLKQLCENNQTIVNGIKTKLMVFGSNEKVSLEFNSNSIEQVIVMNTSASCLEVYTYQTGIPLNTIIPSYATKLGMHYLVLSKNWNYSVDFHLRQCFTSFTP